MFLLLYFGGANTHAFNSLRIVCDNWIELHCASWEESQEVLLKALQLRHAWSRLLESLFSGMFSFLRICRL